MKSKNIYDKDWRYSLLKRCVCIRMHSAYRRITISGKENIPHNGAVIYAPNHTNGMMDAIMVMCASPKDKVFVSRADIFAVKWQARFLNFLRTMPIYRLSDGMHSLTRNRQIMDTAVDTLGNGVDFCIFPESTHRTMHSMLPITKGIFHIALNANETFGRQKSVYIQPMGIEYGAFFRYRSTVNIRFTEPIDITGFVNENKDLSLPRIIDSLRNELSERMQRAITFIPDNEHYKAIWELVKIITTDQYRTEPNILSIKQSLIASLVNIQNSSPQYFSELCLNVETFTEERHSLHISTASFSQIPLGIRITEGITKVLFGLPFFLLATIAMSPALIILWLINRFIIEDKALCNSITFGVDFFLVPPIVAAWSIFMFCSAPWPLACVVTIILLPSFAYFHDYCHLFKELLSDCRCAAHKELRDKFTAIKERCNTLLNTCGTKTHTD